MLTPLSLGPVGQPTLRRPALKAIPYGSSSTILSCGLGHLRLVKPEASPSPQRRVAHVVTAQSSTTPISPATDGNIKFKKGFWTFVDVVAILGSVGGALAAILNLFSGTYILFLPLVLPVVSLLSALQREGLIAEDNRRAYDTLRSSLARDSSVLLADARGAIEEVRRELKGQNTTAARLGTIEARLSSLEGSILSAGRSAREAASGLGLLPDRIQADQRAALEGLVAALRVELRRAAESLANSETTALARLDARLAAVEGSLSGLEVAQSEGVRRLSMSLNSALADAEATLQSSVRNEVARSMEPVRRLPQMLAAALPPALAAAEAVEASAAGMGGLGQGTGGVSPSAVAASTVSSSEQLQAMLGQEVEGAVGRILAFQAEAFGRLNTIRPVPMDDEQWGALGRRLTRLERLVEGVPAGTEGALLQGGQLVATVAAAVREALAAQLAEARDEVAMAAAREADAVRNDILAAQTVLRDSLDGLSGALRPLQLGVTELQLAVAAVSEQQQRQQQMLQQQQQQRQQDQAAPTAVAPDGDGLPEAAAVAAVAVPPAELTRLLDGLTAVAQLLRDVDAKMDAVAAAAAQVPGEMAAAAVLQPPATAPAAPEATSEAAWKQQMELQGSMDSMREALAALAVQVGALAATQQAAGSAAPVSPLAEAIEQPEATQARQPPAAAAAAAAFTDRGGGAASVAEVLSFEASLSAAVTAGPAADGGDVGDGTPLSKMGATREEAYDMMLQLAAARRRSGSEAGGSGGSSNSKGSVAVSARGSGELGTEGAVREGVPSAPPPHLQIVGLPPFEESGGLETELSALPPTQSEVDTQIQQPAVQNISGPPSEALQQQQQQQQGLQSSSWPPSSYEQVQPQAQGQLPPSRSQQSPQQAVAVPCGTIAATAWIPAASQSPESPYVEGYGWQQQQQEAQSVPYAPYNESVQAGESTGEPGVVQACVDSRPAADHGGWHGQSYTSASPTMQEQLPSRQENSGGHTASPSGRAAPSPSVPLQQQQPQPLSTPHGYAQSQAQPQPPPPFPPQQHLQQPSPPPSPGPPHLPPPPPQQQSGARSDAAGLAGAAVPPPAYRLRPLEGLSSNEMISEGLRLLRLGREETRKGEDYGLADTLVQSAIAAFQRASEASPGDPKALGNWGNALLARGELKAAYLEALRSGPPPASYSEVEAQRGAEVAMTMEANALLTQAGVMFMKVLEMEGWSSRALVNWGRALVIRADLLAAAPDGGAVLMPAGAGAGAGSSGAGGPAPGAFPGGSGGGGVLAVVGQLYTSAINKFEGVLEGEPDMVPAKYRCALAMAGLSRCRQPGSREALTLLADAINYLRDVIASTSPDAEALRPTAAAALQQYEAQLMAQRSAGRQQQ